jgi:precorrin-8X/cobalt-precorrin-8 methylmutase
LFDGYLMVDWSAAATPRTGVDSIWYALVEQDDGLAVLDNPPTRAAARHAIRDICHDYVRSGRRLLAGFDFPNGYPRGTAGCAGLDGMPWRALWDHLAAEIEEGEKNANNRFAVAADLNRCMSGRPFPFWGCSSRMESEILGRKKTREFHDDGVPEFRLVERTAKGAKSCWQLLGAGSVGGQVLTGIPVQHALRTDPEFGDAVTVWPFETGLRAPDGGDSWRIVIAEIYPSLFPVAVRDDAVKDAVQVETVARALADWDGEGALSRHFAGPDTLTTEERCIIEREEGWILGAGTMSV